MFLAGVVGALAAFPVSPRTSAGILLGALCLAASFHHTARSSLALVAAEKRHGIRSVYNAALRLAAVGAGLLAAVALGHEAVLGVFIGVTVALGGAASVALVRNLSGMH